MLAMWQWFAQLQGAQASLIGSVVGFMFGIAALIVGALFNFRLNRKRDALLRTEEAEAIAAALYGEIILIRAELARTAKLVANREMSTRPFDKHFLELIRLQDPLLYKALANKLGLLDPKLILAITEFHQKLELVRAWLPDIIESEERKFSYSVGTVLEPAISAIDGIWPTIDALAIDMGIDRPSQEPDVGSARAVIEMEHDKFAQR